MATITNTHKGPLGLPGGILLPPNIPTDVRDWDKLSQNAVIKAWVKSGTLVVSDGASPALEGLPTDRDELFAELEALGIKAGKNAKVETLQAKLAQARAEAALNDGGEGEGEGSGSSDDEQE